MGASGTIGRQLLALAKAAGQKVIATGHARARQDILSFDMRQSTLRSVVPDLGSTDVVYVLAAYSHPSWIYEHASEARDLNVTATQRLIDEAHAAGSRVVFMSSVEVFDGQEGHYRENASPAPLNLYGQMKFEIEQYLAKAKGLSCIVRTGWNIGWDLSSRCVVKLTYQTLIRPQARMARDNIFSVIDSRDTAQGLLRLAQRPEIQFCHFASHPPVIRTELAKKIMEFSRHRSLMDFVEVNFSEIPYSEKRGRLNDLENAFSIAELGMKYRHPYEVIQEKVHFLDQHLADLKAAAVV